MPNMTKEIADKAENLGPEDSLQDFERFSQAIQIINLIKEYSAKHPKQEPNIQDGFSPYDNQTHRGFFLEGYYGLLDSLHTPWGKYRFNDDRISFEEISNKLLIRLGATVSVPEINTKTGLFGPVFAIHKVGDIELPDPAKRPASTYRQYEEVIESLDNLSQQYYESQSQTPPLTIIEKFKLDDVILKARGHKEPPVNENDIKTLEQLDQYKGKVVKYTQDSGRTWHYTKLDQREPTNFSDGSFGYTANEEVMPNIKVHSSYALTDKKFESGMIVRPTNEEEVQNLRFSYQFNDQDNIEEED